MRIAALMLVAVLSGCSCYEKQGYSYDPSSVPFGVFDIYTPMCPGAKEPYPVIFFVHGGAWQMGDKGDAKAFADEFCKDGYAVVSPNYRLAGVPGGGTWPAQIDDVQKALRYVRANAGVFHLNPDKLVSMGVSAGGHLATMVHLRDDPNGPSGRTSFAVDLDGEHDMAMPPEQVMANYAQILTAVFGHGPPWTPAEIKDISTVAFKRADADVFIVHGTGDPNVFFPQAVRLNAVLTGVGAKIEFHKIDGPAGVCHGECWKDPTVLPALHAWIDKRLK